MDGTPARTPGNPCSPHERAEEPLRLYLGQDERPPPRQNASWTKLGEDICVHITGKHSYLHHPKNLPCIKKEAHNRRKWAKGRNRQFSGEATCRQIKQGVVQDTWGHLDRCSWLGVNLQSRCHKMLHQLVTGECKPQERCGRALTGPPWSSAQDVASSPCGWKGIREYGVHLVMFLTGAKGERHEGTFDSQTPLCRFPAIELSFLTQDQKRRCPPPIFSTALEAGWRKSQDAGGPVSPDSVQSSK